jgi:hypothetical protein
MTLTLSPTESQAIILYAFRYCLKRRSYAVGDMCDFLRSRWSELEPHTQQLIVKEIKEEIARDDRSIERKQQLIAAGKSELAADTYRALMQQDRNNWENVLDRVTNKR